MINNRVYNYILKQIRKDAIVDVTNINQLCDYIIDNYFPISIENDTNNWYGSIYKFGNKYFELIQNYNNKGEYNIYECNRRVFITYRFDRIDLDYNDN